MLLLFGRFLMGSFWRIQASLYNFGLSQWQPAFYVSLSGVNACNPSVSLSSNGNGTIAYLQGSCTRAGDMPMPIYAQEYTLNTNIISTPINIGISSISTPEVAANQNNSAANAVLIQAFGGIASTTRAGFNNAFVALQEDACHCLQTVLSQLNTIQMLKLIYAKVSNISI